MKEAVLLQPERFSKKGASEFRPEISVVVPLYNEAESVNRLIEAVSAVLSAQPRSWELILVDDGSTDTTVSCVSRFISHCPQIALLELSRNYGQTAAMQAGIDFAKGSFIVTMDGDLQNDPADIPAMVDHLLANNLDLLVGWRKHRRDKLISRKIPSWLANKLIGAVSGVKLHDYGCSLKVYRHEVIKKIKLMGEMHRFIPIWIASVVPAHRIGEIPVNHHARQFGESKYGLSRSIRVFLDLLSVMFFRRYLARPGHFFGGIGLFVGLLGGAILGWLAVDKFVLGQDIGTRPLLLVGVVSVLMSLQFVTTGILAEMMSRTYFNSADSRNYLVRHIHSANEQPRP